MSKFSVHALRGDDITIYGDGSQTRSLCYVDDLVEAFLKFMDTDSTIHGPINLGTPVEFPIRELAEKVIKSTGARSQLVELPLPEDDPLQRKPDIALARSLFGWEPKVTFDDGLERRVAYFRQKLAS